MPKVGNDKKDDKKENAKPKQKQLKAKSATTSKKTKVLAASKEKKPFGTFPKQEGNIPKSNVDIVESIEKHGYTAVVRAYDTTTVGRIIDQYIKGGLKVLEIATSCPQWAAFVKALRKKAPEVIVGVGTCLTVVQIKTAVSAGAQFVVSPVFNEEVVKEALRLKTPMMPGCATAAEMQRAQSLGCPMQKLFKETSMPVVLSSVGRADCSCADEGGKAKKKKIKKKSGSYSSSSSNRSSSDDDE